MRVFDKTVWFGGKKAVKDFADAHRVGFCRPVSGPCETFTAAVRSVPLCLVNIGAATKTEDQGSTPKCAAYSATSYAENILWRKTGALPPQLDPDAVYRRAKETDGDPGGDGTTLVDVLDALAHLKILPENGKTRVFRSVFDLKAAVHRYGTCLLGLDVTDEWYRGNTFIKDTGARNVGGHAVQCVGYDTDGVWVQNSWGENWGNLGFAHIAWPAFNRQFMYGAFRDRVFGDMI